MRNFALPDEKISLVKTLKSNYLIVVEGENGF